MLSSHRDQTTITTTTTCKKQELRSTAPLSHTCPQQQRQTAQSGGREAEYKNKSLLLLREDRILQRAGAGQEIARTTKTNK